MSITEEGSQGQSNPNQGRPDPRKASGGQGWSLHDGGLFASPIPKSIGSESYLKFKDKLSEVLSPKNVHESVEVNLIDMSRASEPQLDFSCVLVTLRIKEHLKLGVAFYIMLLERTGDGDIPPYKEQYGDRPVNIWRTPSDAINDILIKRARELVRERFRIETESVRFAGGEVIPKAFDIEDVASVHSAALVSVMACATELQTRVQGFTDLNLSTLTSQGQRTVELGFDSSERRDAVGNVFRSDLTITFTDRKGSDSTERKLNSGERTTKFSEVSGYMDVLWYPAQEQNAFASPFMPTQQTVTQKYVPRLVITNIDAVYAPTPGSVLLALSTSLAMRNPNNWILGFRPQIGMKNQKDLRDIGALNYEGNMPVQQPNGTIAPDPSGYGKMIDTKADDFDNAQLGYYIRTLFRGELLISLDVPEYGPTSYYLDVFVASARGNDRATERILRAANELTGGQFSQFFKKGDAIFATGTERIHAGYWTDNNGKKRDLRDFDYTAVANIVGDRYPTMIRDFSDTFLRLDYPEAQRLDARRDIISKLAGDTATFTGWHQRVTFSAAFLIALDQAIASQGLNVTIRSPGSSGDFMQQRGVATFANAGMLGFGPSFIRPGSYSAGPAFSTTYGPGYRQY